MASLLPSDEVAEDFRVSLEDLTFNSRWEISNLTVIAKENIPHALAISRTIENHIKNTPPTRKLPALFLLDSIIKNVGTPYTLYFGRNMYQTFMNAYTLVDAATRKKLEEMLQTWKQPVPGSLNTSPVFQPEITRQIETALIRARTAAIQQTQHLNRATPDLARSYATSTPPVQYRNTPPQHQSAFPPPTIPVFQPPVPQYANSSTGVEPLLSDIASLIGRAQAEFAANPYDEGIRQRLKALLDLQSILQTQRLPQDQIALIRAQVAQLSLAVMPPAAEPVAPPEPPPMFPPNALAALLASTVSQPAQASMPASAPTMSLIDSLREAGLVPPIIQAPIRSPVPAVGTPPGTVGSTLNASIEALTINVDLTPASLKVLRPQLLSLLYEAQSNQCATCGLRFLPTPNGTSKKTAHLDWHFRVNQRLLEAAKRGQNRSWYVDEFEWIRSVDDIDEIADESAGSDLLNGASGTQFGTAAAAPQKKFVKIPDDPVLGKQPCPICQEPFETEWNHEAQEWVWMDAEKVGNRIYHASCRAEVKADAGAGENLVVLGKRKLEDDSQRERTRIKVEG